jgi:hypothetical protein
MAFVVNTLQIADGGEFYTIVGKYVKVAQSYKNVCGGHFALGILLITTPRRQSDEKFF